MKKIIAILLMCIMLMGFAACSDKGESGTQATAGNTAQSKPEISQSTATAETETQASTTEQTATPEATPSEPTAEPIDAFVFDFWHEDSAVYKDYLLDTSGAGTNCTWKWVENSGMEINIMGNDPCFSLNFGGDSFSLSEYHFMKVRIKNTTPATTMEFFIISAYSPGATAGDVMQYPSATASSEEYIDYVIDIEELMGTAYSEREIGSLRMDVLSVDPVISQLPEEGWTIAIDHIGFFPTAEAAQAYTTH